MQNVVQLLAYIRFIMRCSFIILAIQLTFAGVLLATNAKSQSLDQVKVDLSLKQASIQESLLMLQRKSGIRISFFDELLQKETKKVTLTSSSISAGDALRRILAGTKLNYRLVQDFVIIDVKPVPLKPGRISGKVLDEKGEPVSGATVRVVETGAGIQSNIDGTYQLSLAPGTYTLEVTYISYHTKRITGISVTEGKITPLDITMLLSSSALGQVSITADFKKSSVEGLYAKQKNNAAMTDGISAEQIARTPDRNIGETLKRVSGVNVLESKYIVVRGLGERYNSTQINGQVMPSTELNRKQFSFDIIPANMVDNITIYKTINAD